MNITRTFKRIDALSTPEAYFCYNLPRAKGALVDIILLQQTGTWVCAIATRAAHESWNKAGPEQDNALLQRMIACGPEHEKSLRGKLYYLGIEAPRYWWAEMDTYTVGTIPMGSTSTMHKEAKKLKGMELVEAKSELCEGTLQFRVRAFSHPTLRRIISQRKDHRLPEWQEFCAFAEEIIKL